MYDVYGWSARFYIHSKLQTLMDNGYWLSRSKRHKLIARTTLCAITVAAVIIQNREREREKRKQKWMPFDCYFVFVFSLSKFLFRRLFTLLIWIIFSVFFSRTFFHIVWYANPLTPEYFMWIGDFWFCSLRFFCRHIFVLSKSNTKALFLLSTKLLGEKKRQQSKYPIHKIGINVSNKIHKMVAMFSIKAIMRKRLQAITPNSSKVRPNNVLVNIVCVKECCILFRGFGIWMNRNFDAHWNIFNHQNWAINNIQ